MTTKPRPYAYPLWHGPKTVRLSSGEVFSRYDYHQQTADSGRCNCHYCQKERQS